MFRRRKREQDIERELHNHLSLEGADRQADGLPPDQARDAAQRALGNMALIQEDTRAVWTARWLEVFLQDLRYGARMLLHNPGFAAAAILSLALGIGANTAIFTLINALILRPLPVTDPAGLVHIVQGTPHGPLNKWTTAAFEFFHDQPQLFSGVIAQDFERFDVSFTDEPTPIDGVFVSGDYFPTLGVAPFLGRTLTPADDAESGGADGPSAVLSYRFWVARFAADPAVLGRSLTVDGTPLHIVGVLPPSFSGIEVGKSPNLFVPLRLEPMLQPNRTMLHQKYVWWLDVLARKRDGLTDPALQSGLEAIWPRLIGVVVPFSPSRAAFSSARNGISDLRRRFTAPLYILMAIAGIVMLIACANVANLLLARTGSRRREVAVRLAIGASRPRLLRQLLTESLLLSALGSLLGLAIAFAGCRFLLTLLATGIRTVDLNVRPDLAVIAFTALCAVATTLFFGVGPALRVTAAGPGASLKENSQALARGSVGKLLVVAQTALCLLLLVGAGLFVRTFWNLTHQNFGFDARNLYIASIDPRPAGFKAERLTHF
jgi:predicted permease